MLELVSDNNYRELERCLKIEPSEAQGLMDEVIGNIGGFEDSYEAIQVLMDFGASITEEQYNRLQDGRIKSLLAYATNFDLVNKRSDTRDAAASELAERLGIEEVSKEFIAINTCLYLGKYFPVSDGNAGYAINIMERYNRELCSRGKNNELFWRHFRFPIRHGKDGMSYAPMAHVYFYSAIVDNFNPHTYAPIIEKLYRNMTNINARDQFGNTIAHLMDMSCSEEGINKLPVNVQGILPNASRYQEFMNYIYGRCFRFPDLSAKNNTGYEVTHKIDKLGVILHAMNQPKFVYSVLCCVFAIALICYLRSSMSSNISGIDIAKNIAANSVDIQSQQL